MIDASHIGLRPGPDNAAWNRNILQTAIDRLATADGPRVLTLPPWSVVVDRTIELTADAMTLRGRDGSELRMHPHRSDAVLYLGRLARPRAAGNEARVDPADVVPLEGIGLPGRFGLRTYPGYVADPDGPLAHADIADGFTAEFLLDTTEAPLPDYGPIGGVSGYRPWYLQMADGGLYLGLTVSDGTPEAPEQHVGIRAPKPTLRGPVLLTVQVDMITARAVILDGARVLFAGPVPGLAPGRKLVRNVWAPFHLGAEGRSAFTHHAQNIRSDEPRRRTFGGFHLLRGVRYREDGTRLDGRARTLESSLFEPDPNTAGLLELKAGPEAMADRRVEVIANYQGVRHAAYFLDPAHANPWSVQGGYRIEDVSIQGQGYPFGSTVTAPNCLYSGVRRCRIGGHRRAVATWGYSATYTFDAEDCWLEGADAAVFLSYAIANIRRCKVTHAGRVAVELVESRTTIDDLFVMPFGHPAYLVRTERGGQLSARNVVSDWEGREAPTVAGFRLDGGGSHRLDYCVFGWMPKGAPLVWATAPDNQPSDLTITQMDWGHDCGEVVRTGGTWTVEVDAGTIARARARSAQDFTVPAD